MSRSRKKTISQKVVNAATTGMPSPVRKTLGSRLVAGLLVMSILLMLYTGVISVGWENGRPRVSFNRQKAAQLEKQATERVEDFRDEHLAGDKKQPLLPRFGAQEESGAGFTFGNQTDERPLEQLGEQAEAAKDWFGKESKQVWPPSDQQQAAGEPRGPLSNLKQRLERR